MAMSDLNNINLCSWNIHSLQKAVKRKAVLPFLIKEDVSNAFLQRTHLEDNDNAEFAKELGEAGLAASYSSFSRGVAILISKELAFKSLDCVKDSQGWYVIVTGILAGIHSFMNLQSGP